MKNIYKLIPIALFALMANYSFGQTKAMDFNRIDCAGRKHHLFEDLDSGKAVILFFFMPNCTNCPPPAKAIDIMLGNFLKKYPGKAKAYVMPFNNTMSCWDVGDWCISSNLNTFISLDSGAEQVAHCGGFGMPTMALFAGKDHRMVFSDVGYSVNDTTIMRDSMLALINGRSGIMDLPKQVSSLNMFPVPAKDVLNINLSLKENALLSISIIDINGKIVEHLLDEKSAAGNINKQFNTSMLSNGNYMVRFTINGVDYHRKMQVIR